jgi:AraC-like DNA-binding protein
MDLIWSAGELVVAGPDTEAYVATDVPGQRYAGLRFPPGTGPGVLGVPAHELRDQRIRLADLWPARRVRRLTAYVAAAPEPGAALEDCVSGHFAAPDPAVAEILARLRAGASVAATARRVGLSERQLHRRCLAAFGCGPKTLVRILRMSTAVGLAHAGTPFAAVAATAGYADQAHLAREVKALAGVRLGQLITKGHPFAPGQPVTSGQPVATALALS